MTEKLDKSFAEVVGLIQSARQRAYQAVNTALVDLYWQVGEYVDGKVEAEDWGKGTVQSLAAYIRRSIPGIRGFSAQNLWRMRQFYATYRSNEKLSTLSRELPWSHNITILSKCVRPEEREFYLRLASDQRWSFRRLEREIDSALFERHVLSPPIVSPAVAQIHPAAPEVFRDSYVLDFLNLPEPHSESDLQRGLVHDIRRFLQALGPDFCTQLPDKHLLQAKLHEFYELETARIEEGKRTTDDTGLGSARG